jgi:hypothetical protein
MNYLSAVTTPPKVQTPTPTPTNNNTTSTQKPPTAQPCIPLKGLGGGVSPDMVKLLQMERDFIKLQNTFENTCNKVANLEQNMIGQLKDIDSKIENSVATLLTQVEEKIDTNNEKIQSQFGDIMTTKLYMHTMENNAAFKESNMNLLADMKEFFTDRFDRIDTSANIANTTIANLQAAQEQQTQVFNSKLENTTKNLTEMIDNVATGKGIKSSKYITRSAIAKSIMLNATKITKALTDPDKPNAEGNKENEENVPCLMDTSDITPLNVANQHEAMAIVATEDQ